MGHVYADIEIINHSDIVLRRRGYLPDGEIRSTRVTAMVDTGAYTLAINEVIRDLLGLQIEETRPYRLATEGVIELQVTEPVEVHFENRVANCRAIVLPGESEILLGAIPLEQMDVLIDPLRNRLIVNPAHPDVPVLKLK